MKTLSRNGPVCRSQINFFQYAGNIRKVEKTFCDFALLSFSRLYPLHAITLVAVALGQFADTFHRRSFANRLP